MQRVVINKSRTSCGQCHMLNTDLSLPRDHTIATKRQRQIWRGKIRIGPISHEQ